MDAQSRDSGAQAGAKGFRIGAQCLRERSGGFKTIDLFAVKVGDHGEIPGLGQHFRAAFHRRVGVGDGREQDDGGARLAGGAGKPAG